MLRKLEAEVGLNIASDVQVLHTKNRLYIYCLCFVFKLSFVHLQSFPSLTDSDTFLKACSMLWYRKQSIYQYTQSVSLT